MWRTPIFGYSSNMEEPGAKNIHLPQFFKTQVFFLEHLVRSDLLLLRVWKIHYEEDAVLQILTRKCNWSKDTCMSHYLIFAALLTNRRPRSPPPAKYRWKWQHVEASLIIRNHIFKFLSFKLVNYFLFLCKLLIAVEAFSFYEVKIYQNFINRRSYEVFFHQ